MRGAHACPGSRAMMPGIIPADAGSTTSEWPSDAAVWDHPRGCGEHSAATSRRLESGGSSPRMRGAPELTAQLRLQPGIIPADAGSTASSRSGSRSIQDHPRGCGEHGLAWRVLDAQYGSSPRMRGAHHVCRLVEPAVGIIPADAGSTPAGQSASPRSWDHPRGCGEHPGLHAREVGPAGSSPRMRGAPGVNLGDPDAGGIIPADAESTRFWSRTPLHTRDHPRGCGEHIDFTFSNRL